MASDNSKIGTAIPDSELFVIDRKVLLWLNKFPGKPVYSLGYNFLPADRPGMAFTTVQGTYKTDIDILGGYEVDYQFNVIYRIKPGNSDDNRLMADELLNELGVWAINNPPDIGDQAQVLEVAIASPSSYFGAYDNGDEDHQIMMGLTYKVKPKLF